MTTPITMTALLLTMKEGKLAKWHVKVGDIVAAARKVCYVE